jgi:translation initiation factor IF-1
VAHNPATDFDGTVIEVLDRSTFRVKLDNDTVVLAYAAGKTRKVLLGAVAGDRVCVQVAESDGTRGRILRSSPAGR